MKTHITMKRTISIVAGLLISLTSQFAHAGNIFNLQICGKWKSQYVDSGQGEDMFHSTDVVNRNASYAYYKVIQGTTTVSYGVMDGSTGCTEYFSAEDGVQYQIIQSTKFVRDNNRIYYVQPKQNGTNDPNFYNGYVFLYNYYTPSGHASGEYYSHTNIEGTGTGYYANVGPIVGRMLSKANTFNIPANTSFRVVAGDEMGVGYVDNLNVKLHYEPGSEFLCNNKFPVAHEIAGHPIGDLPVKPDDDCVWMTGSPADVRDANQYCHCYEDPVYGERGHCLQSKEKIRCAQNEGWAQFISTVVFNYRDQDDGFFGAYRTTLFPSSYGEPENPKINPWSLDVYDSYKWDVENCDGENTPNHGTEWDWMTFFWQLWDSGEKINISQIHEIWPGESLKYDETTHFWSYLSAPKVAGTVLDTYEYQHFTDMGMYNGVDH